MAVIITAQPASQPDAETRVDRNTAGTIAIFAEHGVVPPGMRVPRHYHPGIESILYLTHGRLIVYIGQDRVPHEAQAGDFIYIPADEIHQLHNPSDTEEAIGITVYNNTSAQDEQFGVVLPD
jgi:quercetin dioxygenase-like cupin family protein